MSESFSLLQRSFSQFFTSSIIILNTIIQGHTWCSSVHVHEELFSLHATAHLGKMSHSSCKGVAEGAHLQYCEISRAWLHLYNSLPEQASSGGSYSDNCSCRWCWKCSTWGIPSRVCPESHIHLPSASKRSKSHQELCWHFGRASTRNESGQMPDRAHDVGSGEWKM